MPEVFYPLPEPAEGTIDPQNTLGAGPAVHSFEVEVLDAKSGAPIANADVIAFASVASRVGMAGTTDSSGIVRMSLPTATIERVIAKPAPGTGYWSAYLLNAPASGRVRLPVQPFVLPYPDSVKHISARPASTRRGTSWSE